MSGTETTSYATFPANPDHPGNPPPDVENQQIPTSGHPNPLQNIQEIQISSTQTFIVTCGGTVYVVGTTAAGGALTAVLRNALYPNSEPWNAGQGALVGTIWGSISVGFCLVSIGCKWLGQKLAS